MPDTYHELERRDFSAWAHVPHFRLPQYSRTLTMLGFVKGSFSICMCDRSSIVSTAKKWPEGTVS